MGLIQSTMKSFAAAALVAVASAAPEAQPWLGYGGFGYGKRSADAYYGYGGYGGYAGLGWTWWLPLCICHPCPCCPPQRCRDSPLHPRPARRCCRTLCRQGQEVR